MLDLAKLNLDGIAAMRSGGSVLKAAGPFTYWGADEGALPREHRPRAGRAELYREHCPQAGCAELYREHCPQAGCAELTRASSACRTADQLHEHPPAR